MVRWFIFIYKHQTFSLYVLGLGDIAIKYTVKFTSFKYLI